MDVVITYQDYIESGNKEVFITQSIQRFKASEWYQRALLSKKYFDGENPTIMETLQWLWSETGREEDEFKANNKIPTEMYREIIMQENSYLLSNGVNFNDDKDEIKTMLGKNVDSEIFRGGISALNDGCCWIYCHKKIDGYDLKVFKGTEFIPIIDEFSGEIRAGIRFWQFKEDKPIWVEFYDMEGKEVYKIKGGNISLEVTKVGHSEKVQTVMGEVVEKEVIKYPVFPIFPWLGTYDGRSSLTVGLQKKIDACDLCLSGFANNLEDSQDLYWILKNYEGTGMNEFLSMVKKYKVVKTSDEGGADVKTVDIPYQARKEFVDMIKKEIYSSAMAMNISDNLTGNITATAIKMMSERLNLKVDIFEMNLLKALNQVVELIEKMEEKKYDYSIELQRRTLINDSEEIDMLYTYREDIDLRTALELNPKIPNDKIEEIMDRKMTEGIDEIRFEEDEERE